jgi:hypothetical protein
MEVKGIETRRTHLLSLGNLAPLVSYLWPFCVVLFVGSSHVWPPHMSWVSFWIEYYFDCVDLATLYCPVSLWPVTYMTQRLTSNTWSQSLETIDFAVCNSFYGMPFSALILNFRPLLQKGQWPGYQAQWVRESLDLPEDSPFYPTNLISRVNLLYEEIKCNLNFVYF